MIKVSPGQEGSVYAHLQKRPEIRDVCRLMDKCDRGAGRHDPAPVCSKKKAPPIPIFFLLYFQVL